MHDLSYVHIQTQFEDALKWSWTKDGKYSVKSFYMTMIEAPRQQSSCTYRQSENSWHLHVARVKSICVVNVEKYNLHD